MHTRFNIFLAFVLIFCAIYVIDVQYRARHLFIELERAQNLTRQYELEWTLLKLDQSTFGKHARIEAVAQKEIQMMRLTPDRTQYLSAEASK